MTMRNELLSSNERLMILSESIENELVSPYDNTNYKYLYIYNIPGYSHSTGVSYLFMLSRD